MVVVCVCVGSSCYLKGAPEIVEMLESKVAENGLSDKVMLVGSFCSGKCNRVGVTVTVNDEVTTGVTKETFNDFWNGTIMTAVKNDSEG